VVDHRSQKEDANWIWITAGENSINYNEELLVPTMDLVTGKLHWNSVVSTALAKYICIDMKISLTVKLEYFEYMTIPLMVFPQLIVEQYSLNRHAFIGKVHLESRRAVWGLPQAGILANKQL
jgi:hypothetical protein